MHPSPWPTHTEALEAARNEILRARLTSRCPIFRATAEVDVFKSMAAGFEQERTLLSWQVSGSPALPTNQWRVEAQYDTKDPEVLWRIGQQAHRLEQQLRIFIGSMDSEERHALFGELFRAGPRPDTMLVTRKSWAQDVQNCLPASAKAVFCSHLLELQVTLPKPHVRSRL